MGRITPDLLPEIGFNLSHVKQVSVGLMLFLNNSSYTAR